MWDQLWIGADLATCAQQDKGYGLMTQGALGIHQGKIVWVGQLAELNKAPAQLAKEVIDVTGQVITPGLIDCHTHLVYAGDRAHDFSLRLHGATYQEIAAQGGGIISTVKATRKASFKELYEQTLKRAQRLIKHGVTTLEIKSGYGLLQEFEIKQLEVILALKKALPIHIESTFLAAHALPPEYQDRSDDYIAYVCENTLPYVAKHKLATAVDVFCESIAFSCTQVEKIFIAAQKLGLKIKIHAEQLTNQKSALLAATYGALSADHIEYIDEAGVETMAHAKTVAVLLPGAFYFLREKQLPPIALFRKHQVPMALATDSNPGTSPTTNLPLMLNMAATFWHLTPEECLRGVTINAAQALGLADTCGSLEVGKNADFIIWNMTHPDQLTYYLAPDFDKIVICKGHKV